MTVFKGNFSLMKFQKLGTKHLISEYSSSYFAISPEALDWNSLMTSIWKSNLNMQILRKRKLKILKKSGDWDVVSPNCPNVANALKHLKLGPQIVITLE